jgi:hypothetical protein
MIPVATIDKVKIERQIFEDAWQLVKKYYYISMARDKEEEYLMWKHLNNDLRKVFDTDGDEAIKILAKNLTMGVLEYIELRNKE